MRTANSWIATGLVVVLVGMAGRPAYAEEPSIVAPVATPLSPRYLPQTLAPARAGRRHECTRPVRPRPSRGARPGQHASLDLARRSEPCMWAGIVVGALIVVAVLTIPRD